VCPARLPQRVVSLLKATEGVVRTFQRSKLWRDAPQQYKGAGRHCPSRRRRRRRCRLLMH
jgi:hypothetical protein